MRTAHATAQGFVIIVKSDSLGPTKGALAVQYTGEYQKIKPEQLDILYQLMDADDLQETKELLANPNYLGRASNFAELKNAQVAYTIFDEKTEDPNPFVEEDIWINGRAYTLNGELKGFYEVNRSTTSEELEPLTLEEAYWLLRKLGMLEELAPDVLARSQESLIKPLLANLSEKIINHRQKVDQHNWHAGRFLCNEAGHWVEANEARKLPWRAFHGLVEGSELQREKQIDLLMRRLTHTVEHDVLGGVWAHQTIHNITDRQGIIDIVEELGVQGRSPQAQYVDDDLPDLEKQAKEVSLYKQLFDKEGKNLGSSDRALYYWRCTQKAQDRFSRLFKAIHELPLASLIKHFGPNGERLRQLYRNSVRSCSPGPARALVDGQWKSVPLSGASAKALLVEKGFKLEDLHPEVRYHRGNTWHKVLMSRELWQEIEKALAIRFSSSPAPFHPITKESRTDVVEKNSR